MIKVDAELDNVPLYNGSVDLCDLLVQVGEKCPIDPMSARNTTTVSIPVVHVRKRLHEELGCGACYHDVLSNPSHRVTSMLVQSRRTNLGTSWHVLLLVSNSNKHIVYSVVMFRVPYLYYACAIIIFCVGTR